jgi:argininosuccinate lyase
LTATDLVNSLRRTLVDEARKHLISHNGLPAIMPGHTHLQIAQPIHLSHWFLAHEAAFERDASRIQSTMDRMNECPLGAVALAGTSWPIDRMQTSAALGFRQPQKNSIDAVGARDFVCEALSSISILATNLSRLAEDLILFSSSEFMFVEPPHAYSTGSSIMPQKRNSDFCELTRGKASGIIGSLASSLILIKGIPSSYQRDLQEDKAITINTFKTILSLLRIWPRYLEGLSWNLDHMASQASANFSLATDMADALVKTGVSFREAHHAVRQLVFLCKDQGKDFSKITLQEAKKEHVSFTQSHLDELNVRSLLSQRVSLGGSGDETVRLAVSQAISDLRPLAFMGRSLCNDK